MLNSFKRFSLWLAGMVIFGMTNAFATENYLFEIPAQSLNEALVQLAADANLELIFTADIVRGIKAGPVSGNMTAEEALSKLLQNTGLSFRFLDAETVTLVPQVEPDPMELESQAVDRPGSSIPLRVLKPMLVIGKEKKSGSFAANRQRYRVSHTFSSTRTDTPINETPQSIQVIPRALMADQQNLTISESLRNVSGVTTGPVVLMPSFDFTRIRGLRAEQMLDSFTQYYNPGDRESLVNVERIEVLKGSNALLYGGGSGSPAGGLVNIVSKLPHSKASREVGMRFGSYQYYQPWFDFNLPVNDRLGLRVTGEFTRSDSSIDAIQTERFNINPALTLTANANTALTVQGKFSKWEQPDYQGLPVTGTLAGDFSIAPDTYVGPKDIDPSRAEFYGVWGTFDHAFDETWSINLKARYSESIFDQKTVLLVGSDGLQADLPSIPPSIWSLLNTELYQEQQEFSFVGNTLAQFETGPVVNKLLMGFDYSRYTDAGFIDSDVSPVGFVDLSLPAFYPAYRTPGPGENNVFVTNKTYGAYLQLQSTVFERLHFLGGLRLGSVIINHWVNPRLCRGDSHRFYL